MLNGALQRALNGDGGDRRIRTLERNQATTDDPGRCRAGGGKAEVDDVVPALGRGTDRLVVGLVGEKGGAVVGETVAAAAVVTATAKDHDHGADVIFRMPRGDAPFSMKSEGMSPERR